ncbi:nucleotidyltransferase domain-containing protein [Cytobacillus spongiae]|uniref:nucleotidyltransferase domain-containing protein n=1 Tax=Cytobacillus spongiae TaxID=2901381 RepID=UPI001F2FE7ED|nr:nucleotidyltransferase domain-containing protein [Cytobacillus spongiae]UII55915.1 nucleotidyltransferase domain-containing protein [Cytobacillus spongiae]
MVYSWETCSCNTQNFVLYLLEGIKEIVEINFVGFYIHGSLAMGGFNPNCSDIDVLVVTKNPLRIETKRMLAKFLLTHSSEPFPVEISFLNKEQLKNWEHPCPFDFHYSEFWRERYVSDLFQGKNQYINDEQMKDVDLAAHITIITQKGICLEGPPKK